MKKTILAVGVSGGVTESVAEALETELRAQLPKDRSADVVICETVEVLRQAKDAGIGERILLSSGFDGVDAQDATAIFVPTEEVRLLFPRDLRARTEAFGPIGLFEGAPITGDARTVLREEFGLTPDETVIVVDGALLSEVGATALLFQLDLVSERARYLVDVGRDVELAEGMRSLAKGHAIKVGIFADSDATVFAAADIVLCDAKSRAISLAFSAGAGLVVLSEGRSADAAAALSRTNAALVASSPSRLSLTLDSAISNRSELQEASVAMKAHETAEKIAKRILEGRNDRLPSGLPTGVEWLAGSGTAASEEPSVTSDEAGDLEAQIDRELEELRKKV